MINSQIFLKKLCLMSFGVALMMVLVDTARADEQVTRRHTFELDDIDTVVFSNNVGRFEIVPTDNQEMRITVDIEASERGFSAAALTSTTWTSGSRNEATPST